MAIRPKSIKLLKKKQSAGMEPLPEVVVVENRQGCPRIIQSWVKEFRQRDRQKSLAAFDSLFKD